MSKNESLLQHRYHHGYASHSFENFQGVNALSMAYQPTCVLPKLPSADPTAFFSFWHSIW